MKFARRKNMTLLFLLFMSIILMGIGYASIQSVTGEITGKVSSKMQDGVFITNVEYVSDVDANLNNSKIEKITGLMMQSTVELSKTNLNSQITYKVTVYNSSTEEVPFTDVLYGDEFYDNTDITFDITGFTIGQIIEPQETKDIIITFKYNGVIPEKTTLNSYLRFKLDVPNRMVLANEADKDTSNYLTGSIARNKIEIVKFEKGTEPNTDVVAMFDASEKQDESIIGYYTDIDSNGLYELTFMSNDIIYANENAQYLFKDLTNVKAIHFDNFSTFGVINMYWMFGRCKNISELDLSNFNTSKVTDMYCMFTDCSNITELDLSGFNTSNVTDMGNMFSSCNKIAKLNLSSFDTINVTEMDSMFAYCSNITELDLSNFNTINVTDMSLMFRACNNISELDLSNFNTINVTDMYRMFCECYKITKLNLSSFDTSNVTNMGSMFYACRNITELDLSNFDTINVTDIENMFYNCYNLTTIYVNEFDSSTNKGWTTINCKSANVFSNSKKLVGGNGTTYSFDKNTTEYARIDTDGAPGYFTKKGQKPNEDVTTEPYLPTGFTQVNGTTLDNGYTIQDSNGNQYVWIEVPKTGEVYSTAGLGITAFTDEEYTKIEDDLHKYTNDYRGGTSYKDEYYSDAVTGLTSTQYTELKQKMLKSVYSNGGFYVGKYETGIEDTPKTSGSSSTAPTEIPVIKQNAYPYNYVTCSQAQTLASNMESGNYTSSLMFGVQWDLVLKHLETKGTAQADLKDNSTNWGNYYNNSWNITNANSKYAPDDLGWTNGAYGKKDSNTSVLLSTGASETFSKQGIYDIAGNVWEWTLEYTSNSDHPCDYRGGNCYCNGGALPAVYRISNSTTGYYDTVGFRVSLF